MNRKNEKTGGDVSEKIKKLEEGGKYEVKELVLALGEKTYKALIRVDFDLYRKAYGILLNAKFSKAEKGKDSEVDLEMDMLGAGDKILFFGWVEGDEEIKEKVRLRASACQELGSWFTEMIDEADDEEGEEKKS